MTLFRDDEIIPLADVAEWAGRPLTSRECELLRALLDEIGRE